MPVAAVRKLGKVRALAVTLASIVMATGVTAADFAPIPLDRLIGTAAVIVVGDVAAVKDGTFTLRVTESLAGRAPAEIAVRQFVPDRFEGTPRPAPYKAGQSFLLFLSGDVTAASGGLRILGAGGEGEMPIDRGFVYFPGRTVSGLPAGAHTVHEAPRTIQRFELPAVIDAIKGYRACFEWKPGSGEQDQPTQKCNAAALDKFARTSAFHAHLSQVTARRFKR
jgi:hypothetical protein